MKSTGNRTLWCLIGQIRELCFLGKEIIFFGKGCHLYFFNVNTKASSFYSANDAAKGDGISCYAGHSKLEFFAFAENCAEPRIFIMKYPEFQTISILEGGSKEGYMSLSFSESSVFMSLGILPYFTLTAWDWKNGQNLGSSPTYVKRQEQVIRCSPVKPVRVSHLGVNSSRLHIWMILMTVRKCSMLHNIIDMSNVKAGAAVGADWSVDGTLYVLDNTGSVFTVNADYAFERVISYSGTGSLLPSFTIWKGGQFVVTGPDKKLRFYRKEYSNYKLYDVKDPRESFVKLVANRSEIFIAITEKSVLVKYTAKDDSYETIRSGDTDIGDMCMVNPVGQYACLFCQSNIVSTIEVSTGRLMSQFVLMGTALVMASNPEFPYIGIGYINGMLELVSIFDPTKPTRMTSFNLTRNRINSIYFSEFGATLVAADVNVGEFFILEGIPGGQFKMKAMVSAQCQIVDYMLVPSTNVYRIFFIPVTSHEYLIGNKVVRYCITIGAGTNRKEYSFRDPKLFYFRILSTTKINRDRVFYMMSWDRKCIDEVLSKRATSMLEITQTIVTGHQFSKNSLYLDKHHAVTWASDGFVIAKKPDLLTVIGVVLAHHRRDGGVKRAFIDPAERFVMSLGYDNVVACTKLDHIENRKLYDTLVARVNSPKFSAMFQRETMGLKLKEEYQDYIWIEVMEKMENEKTQMEYETERNEILGELKLIKKNLHELIDENLEGPKNERLDMLEFNLDTKAYLKRKKENADKCEEIVVHTKKYTAEMYNVCDRIKAYCHDTMEVQKRKVLCIYSSNNVENYAILKAVKEELEELKLAKDALKIERHFNKKNEFHPWAFSDYKKWAESMEENLTAKEMPNTTTAFLAERMMSEPNLDENRELAEAGSTARKYVEIPKEKYNQMEMQSFYQLKLQSLLTSTDTINLRRFFNQEFDKLVQIKEREVHQIIQRNRRLDVIIDELNYFSKDKIFNTTLDPVWSKYEKIERIITVTDEEIPIKPYISPSQQAILDAQAAEAERLRLLLLADDFKERALMKMMNGVLEMRWEDELKKDVPMPKCMLVKQPEQYNQEDLRAIFDYEKKVEFLNSERERYKILLAQEHAEIISQIRESVKKFDSRIATLLDLKIGVDEAIIQEILILCTHRIEINERLAAQTKILRIKKSIVETEEYTVGLQAMLKQLQDVRNDFRKETSELKQNKERQFEKQFKRDISVHPMAVQEAARKLLKRRPKVHLMDLTSWSILDDLSRSIVTDYRPLTLTANCIEYLKALDKLDQFVGLPPLIDENVYSVTVKHRRLRIEHDIRMLASSSSLAESDRSINIIQKRIASKKEQKRMLMEELEVSKKEALERIKNIRVQFVLKQGCVEVPMDGQVTDFDETILIQRAEIENLNKLILDRGEIKLNIFKKNIELHTEIMKNEWRHRKMRMIVTDLQEELNDIDHIRLTKEMQVYLKGKESEMPFEVELKILTDSYEHILKEKKAAVQKSRRIIKLVHNQSKKLDQEIMDTNYDICEYKLYKDWKLDDDNRELMNKRMVCLAKRSNLIHEIQDNHQTILLLQTELQLLKLKRFPCINYKLVRQ